MTDTFGHQMRSAGDPAITVFDIDPNDAADLPNVTAALNVSTPGIVRVTTADGSIGELSLQPGHAFPVRARKVWLTGTTATGIRGLI